MDKESEKLAEASATKAVEHALEVFGDVVDEKLTAASADCEKSSEQQNDVLVEPSVVSIRSRSSYDFATCAATPPANPLPMCVPIT